MKKLKILFFGLGSIGQRHLINLHRILGSRADFYALRKTRNKYIIKSSKKSSVDIEKK